MGDQHLRSRCRLCPLLQCKVDEAVGISGATIFLRALLVLPKEFDCREATDAMTAAQRVLFIAVDGANLDLSVELPAQQWAHVAGGTMQGNGTITQNKTWIT
jgi:hypothetical protein